ncbi:MAG: hypothetical protein AAF443_02620 [Chlamydiota bacterium]
MTLRCSNLITQFHQFIGDSPSVMKKKIEKRWYDFKAVSEIAYKVYCFVSPLITFFLFFTFRSFSRQYAPEVLRKSNKIIRMIESPMALKGGVAFLAIRYLTDYKQRQMTSVGRGVNTTSQPLNKHENLSPKATLPVIIASDDLIQNPVDFPDTSSSLELPKCENNQPSMPTTDLTVNVNLPYIPSPIPDPPRQPTSGHRKLNDDISTPLSNPSSISNLPSNSYKMDTEGSSPFIVLDDDKVNDT